MSTDTETRFKIDLAWTTPVDIHWSLMWQNNSSKLSCKQQGFAAWTKALNSAPGFPTTFQQAPATPRRTSGAGAVAS